MANTLKIKRGTAATIPQGQLAEPLFTTDTYDLYIGKGSGGNQRFQKYIASGTSSQFLKGDGSLDSTSYQTALTFSSPLVNTSGTISIPVATGSVDGYLSSTDWTTFNSKEPAITAGTSLQYYRGDKTFQTLDTAAVPENGPVYFTEPKVRATVLTGLNLTSGGSIAATDSVLQAFGKVQNQISALVGSVYYAGTWNASTNVPTLASGTGTKGYYYIVTVAGSTNLDGITDWKIGDWAIFNGTTWDKVDNTDAVSSVNGFTGAVNLALDNISDVSAASPTNAQLLRFNGTSSLWENWTPTYISAAITSLNGLTDAIQTFATGTTGTDFGISSAGTAHTFNLPIASATNTGKLSSTDWSTFNSKEPAITAGTTAQYWRGDKTFQDFNTSARAAISLTTTGSSGSSTYSSTTGVLNVPTYTLSGLGGVPTTRQLTINGTAYDLSADRSWSVGTVTSVAALTIGTTGTNVTSTVANGTTTPVITLNIPDASATARGLITTGTQTIGGNKTFSKSILVGGGSDGEYAITLGEGRSGNGFSYIDLVGDATYTDYGLRIIRSNGGANTSSSIIHRGTGDLIVETTEGGAIRFRNSAGTNAATISGGNLTLNNGGDLVITAATSGSNTTLNNDTGTLLISTSSQITGNLTLASGGDLVITAASSGPNTTLYNDIGKLICTTSLSVSGTGEFSSSVSATSFIVAGGTASQFLKANGTLDSNTYLTGNQTITLSGDISGSGTTAISTTIGALKVTDAMLAGSINYSKMNSATVPTWNQNTTGNAATSTALQTARNINGTSFNGTSNITTSSWGTARTVTIGSTGKSVDGSVNVSWTLGELGSQPQLNGTGFVKASGTTISYDNSTYLTTSSAASTYLALSGGTVGGTTTFSNGIRFGGGSGLQLNFYEEGNWTPVLRGSGTAGTFGYAFRSGTYVRIGNYVFARWGFKLNSASGASGTVQITGLPYTSVNFGAYQEPSVSVATGLLATAANAARARMFVGGNTTFMEGRVGDNGDTAWPISDFSGDEWIIGEIFYNV